MANYKCLECGKDIDEKYITKKIRCPYCGSRMIIKSQGDRISKVIAR